MKRQLLAEFIGTFTLVLAGTGAIVSNQIYPQSVTHPGIALTFGLVVMAMIYTFGENSGAHFNPAVTLGFFTTGKFPASRVIPYILAQCSGACLASGLLKLLYLQKQTNLGATIPSDLWWQSFILELILTFILMTVILLVATGSKEQGLMAGIAIGGTVGLEAMFAGPMCGASMNPARSLAPALFSGELTHLWLYLVAPAVGALLAVPVYNSLKISDK